MKIGTPEGVTRVCGAEQGYQPLPIRDEGVSMMLNGQLMVAAAMITCWEPTEDERLRLLAGEPIYLRTLGTVPAPITVGVGDPKTYGW